jgi:hypothetical protein
MNVVRLCRLLKVLSSRQEQTLAHSPLLEELFEMNQGKVAQKTRLKVVAWGIPFFNTKNCENHSFLSLACNTIDSQPSQPAITPQSVRTTISNNE